MVSNFRGHLLLLLMLLRTHSTWSDWAGLGTLPQIVGSGDVKDRNPGHYLYGSMVRTEGSTEVPDDQSSPVSWARWALLYVSSMVRGYISRHGLRRDREEVTITWFQGAGVQHSQRKLCFIVMSYLICRYEVALVPGENCRLTPHDYMFRPLNYSFYGVCCEPVVVDGQF